MKTTLLAWNADILITMDAARRGIQGGGFLARDGVIEGVDTNADLPETADKVIDLSGMIATSGLINTHHPFYYNRCRSVPAGQDATLFGWLQAHYAIWAQMGPEAIRILALVALAELALTGCVCSSDPLCMFPNGVRLDDEIDAD